MPIIPSGSLVHYLPSKRRNAAGDKFSPSSEEGLLVGYHMNPGSRWTKDFYVVNREATTNTPPGKLVPLLRVGAVYKERQKLEFPMTDIDIIRVKDPAIGVGREGSSDAAPQD